MGQILGVFLVVYEAPQYGYLNIIAQMSNSLKFATKISPLLNYQNILIGLILVLII